MSFLSSLTHYATNAFNAYQEAWQKITQDGWARSFVSEGCPKKVQDIFNTAAQGKLVGYFSKSDEFFKGTHKSDVAVLEAPQKNSSERSFKAIVFYVGGISDESIELPNPSMNLTSILKIRDIVAPIILMSSGFWVVSNQTLESDFGNCINFSKAKKEKPLKENFEASASVLEEIVSGTHPQFGVISKEEFDKSDYIVASIWIEDIAIEKGYNLAICGTGIGMNRWKKAIPMDLGRCGPNYWEVAIRGKKETCEYKLALLKPDGSFQLEVGTIRKLKDMTPDSSGNYNLQLLSPPDFSIENPIQEGWVNLFQVT